MFSLRSQAGFGETSPEYFCAEIYVKLFKFRWKMVGLEKIANFCLRAYPE